MENQETQLGKKGTKLARFDLIPPQTMIELAEHYGKGLEHYPERNWSKSYAAMLRHAHQFWSGSDFDSCDQKCRDGEDTVDNRACDQHTGSKHLIAVAWHALTLARFMDTHKNLDDRPSI